MYGEQVHRRWIEAWLTPFDIIRAGSAHALASGIAVGILTYLHIVIGEMVPKWLALQSAMRTVDVGVADHRGARDALLPLVVVLNAAGNGLLRLMGIKREQNEASAITPAKSCSSSSRKATNAAAARRVGTHPARALRIRRPDGGPGDGAARPPGGHPGRHRHRGRAEIIRRLPTPGIRSIRVTSTTSRAASTSRSCCGTSSRDAGDRAGRAGAAPRADDDAPRRGAGRHAARRAHMAVVMDEHGGTAGVVTIERPLRGSGGRHRRGSRPAADRERRPGRLAFAAPCA